MVNRTQIVQEIFESRKILKKIKELKMDLIPVGIWLATGSLFPILWSVPYLLGWQSPIIGACLNWPVQLVRVQKKHLAPDEVPDEIHLLFLETLRFGLFFLTIWFPSSALLNLLWWRCLGIILETLLDIYSPDSSEIILNLKFRILLGSILLNIWGSLWSFWDLISIGMFFFLEIQILFPLTIPK